VRFAGAERAVGRIFVPTDHGLHECVADLSEEEYQRYRREAPSVWADFTLWWGTVGTAGVGRAAGADPAVG